MTSKLTRERIELIANFHRAIALPPSHAEIEELARMALAAMDSEPVIIVGDDGGDALAYRRLIQSFAPGTKLYRHAQPAPERDQVRREHAEWSQATFGNVGPVGPLKHLSKEALEAAAEPGDLSEWADMQFLLWDAQRRAGITDEQITQAMIDKLAVNKQRSWPEPKDGEPRLHIKEQPAPVVPDGIERVASMAEYLGDFSAAAIIRQLAANQPQNAPQNIPEIIPGWIPVSERMPEVGDIVLTAMGVVVNVGEMECSAANCRFFTSVISGRELPATHWMPLPAAPQEVGDA